KSCSVTPAVYNESNGGLLVLVSAAGVRFSNLGEGYPDTRMKVRVDKNSAMSFADSLSGKSAANLISQLAKGNRVITEFYDWPYNVARHRKVPICDLPAKIQKCKDSISR